MLDFSPCTTPALPVASLASKPELGWAAASVVFVLLVVESELELVEADSEVPEA